MIANLLLVPRIGFEQAAEISFVAILDKVGQGLSPAPWVEADMDPPISLLNQLVDDIHKRGGRNHLADFERGSKIGADKVDRIAKSVRVVRAAASGLTRPLAG